MRQEDMMLKAFILFCWATCAESKAASRQCSQSSLLSSRGRERDSGQE